MVENLKTLQARIGRLERKIGLAYGDVGTLEPQSTISAWNDATPRAFIGIGRALAEGTGITITKIANSPYLQISGTSDACLSTYIVDPAGAGSHTTLEGAIDAAILTGLNSSIWICGDITEGSIDVGGMGSAQHIYISSTDRNIVKITSPTNEDIFEQTTQGGNTSGGLHFRNIGFRIVTGGRAIYRVGVITELREMEFNSCKFDGGYLLRQNTELHSLGAMNLIVNDCSGSAQGFYKIEQQSGTLSPDQLNATNNFLTLTEWWTSNPLALASPDVTRINGGRYIIATGLQWSTGSHQQHFMNIILDFSASGPAFATASTTLSIRDFSFSNIVFRTSNAGSTFADFQGFNINVNTGLFIKVIDAFPIVALTAGTTFITVGTNWASVLVANIQARGWTTTFEGPGGVGDDHGELAGILDDDHPQYALLAGRSGGQTLIGGTGAVENLTLQATSHATTGEVVVSQGNLRINTRPIDGGILQILGAATGFEGGGIELFLSDEHNSVFTSWNMDVNADDLRFFTIGGATVNRFTPEGALNLPRDGPSSGLFLGSSVRLYRGSFNQLILANGDSFKIDSGFIDIDEISVPADPGSAVRRLFTNAATNELSVRTASGTTKSLEKMKWVTTISFGWDAQTAIQFTPV